jgi:iron complex transport system substrate-binding protein
MLTKKVVTTTLVAIMVIAVVATSLYYSFFYDKNLHVGKVEETPSYIIVTDVTNRTVEIPANLSRVVAIGPGALRLVVYLNATDLLVGVEEVEVTRDPTGRDYGMAQYNILKNLPIVGPGGPNNPPDLEKLRAVKPQLIIMSGTYAQLYPPDRLAEEVNASVLVIDYGTAGYLDVEALKNALLILGKALGREGRAKSLINYIDQIVSDLNNRTRGIDPRPKVYVGAISYKGGQPFTSTQARFAPLQLLNTPSIIDSVAGKAGYMSIDFEYLVQQQPDFVFIDENNLNIVLSDYSKDPSRYCSLNAFRAGRVYGVLPFNYYHTSIATALANAYFIGKVLYPDRFVDVDPVVRADEIFTMFVGKPIYQGFINGGYKGFVNLSELFPCG